MNALRRSWTCCLLVAGLFWAGAGVAQTAAPRDVLFIGNSFTYYNNSVHNHYRELVESAAPDGSAGGRTRAMTISGGQLHEHFGGLKYMLNEFDWDVVVLQGHSLEPISDDTASAFRLAARNFTGKIRDDGAEPVFFMTWAYTDEPGMTAELKAAYSSIAGELKAVVAPVGLAFAAVTGERPDIKLRVADKKHPTLAGSYLAACVFFAVLQDRSPQGLGYTAGLDAETAEYLQRIAWQTVSAR